MTLFGVRLLWLDAQTGEKLLFTVVLICVYAVLRRLLGLAARRNIPATGPARVAFWVRQVINLVLIAALAIGLLSIWFEHAEQVATVTGLFTAGIAFALQRVITAFAAYLVILRGSTFSVGDRIVMGGVRGDVIALDPFQTTIMEMGEAKGEQGDAPSLWVHGRQFTGRIVTVNNGTIFDQPVYNYTRDFPYIWDEIMLPVPYDGDEHEAERIMLEAVGRHAVKPEDFEGDQRVRLTQRYGLEPPEIAPRAFYQLTDNWIAISVRFLVGDHSARFVKDAVFREILAGFRAAGISVASGTYAIVQVPPLRIETAPEPPVRTLQPTPSATSAKPNPTTPTTSQTT